MTDGEADPREQRPMLRVVHGGEPTPDEIAALVVALDAISTTAQQTPRRRSGWADRRALLRRPLEHGPGRWAASARPAR